jgi:hypothetical protein
MNSTQLLFLIFLNIGLACILIWVIFGSFRTFFDGIVSECIPSIVHALKGDYESHLSISCKFWVFHILLFIAILTEIFILRHV